jgi:hypothetical protein
MAIMRLDSELKNHYIEHMICTIINHLSRLKRMSLSISPKAWTSGVLS